LNHFGASDDEPAEDEGKVALERCDDDDDGVRVAEADDAGRKVAGDETDRDGGSGALHIPQHMLHASNKCRQLQTENQKLAIEIIRYRSV